MACDGRITTKLIKALHMPPVISYCGDPLPPQTVEIYLLSQRDPKSPFSRVIPITVSVNGRVIFSLIFQIKVITFYYYYSY